MHQTDLNTSNHLLIWKEHERTFMCDSNCHATAMQLLALRSGRHPSFAAALGRALYGVDAFSPERAGEAAGVRASNELAGRSTTWTDQVGLFASRVTWATVLQSQVYQPERPVNMKGNRCTRNQTLGSGTGMVRFIQSLCPGWMLQPLAASSLV